MNTEWGKILNTFKFESTKAGKGTSARAGVITTPHGKIQTPAFVPVGTQATVKSLTPLEIKETGTKIFFVNTYHTYLRPTLAVIEKFGGIHTFMGWDCPIISDSGGFQVFSLARPKFIPTDRSEDMPSLVKITEDGVKFRSHWDGSEHFFTPESSMEYQWKLGSDIHIAFDDCTAYPVTHVVAKKSMKRTHRWAMRSLEEHEKLSEINSIYQALYGVVQGSVFEDLRKESAKYIFSLNFDGIAIGGVSVGESKKEMEHVLKWVVPELPDGKPRHLLGVGEIDDIFVLIENGIDTFDCVQPTRMARMGRVFVFDESYKSYQTNKFELDITKKLYAMDTKPIDETCICMTCKQFSRAYLHHLFSVRELLGYRLATIHNMHFINNVVASIRASIINGTFHELKKRWDCATV